MARRARRSYAKRRERRKKILDAASDACALSRYRGAPVTAVASRAGMSDAGLLYDFTSKENLLLAVLQERDQHNTESIERALNARESFADAMLELCAQNAASPAMVGCSRS